MNDERDDLGAAIRDLPVPDHRPDFWSTLEQTLDEAGSPRPPSPSRWLTRAAFAAMSIAAVVAFFAVVMNATKTRDRVVSQPADGPVPVKMVRGTAVLIDRGTGDEGGKTTTVRFADAADGSRLRRNAETGELFAFDAEQDRMVSVVPPSSPSGPREATVWTGAPPLAFRTDAVQPLPPAWDAMAAYIVALGDSGDSRAAAVTFLGRDAWRLLSPVNTGTDVDEIDLTVDSETGVVLAAEDYAHGALRRTYAVASLETAGSIDRSVFAVVVPADAVPTSKRGSFNRSSFDELRVDNRFLGLAAPLVPDGYRLQVVGGAAVTANPTGPLAPLARADDVVVAVYRKGFRALVVTTGHVSRDNPVDWTDPFLASSMSVRREPIELPRDREYPGATGEVVVDPASVPHVWATSGDGDTWVVLTVAGPLRRDDLVAVATSVRRF
jgi:hypothetical protein